MRSRVLHRGRRISQFALGVSRQTVRRRCTINSCTLRHILSCSMCVFRNFLHTRGVTAGWMEHHKAWASNVVYVAHPALCLGCMHSAGCALVVCVRWELFAALARVGMAKRWMVGAFVSRSRVRSRCSLGESGYISGRLPRLPPIQGWCRIHNNVVRVV